MPSPDDLLIRRTAAEHLGFDPNLFRIYAKIGQEIQTHGRRLRVLWRDCLIWARNRQYRVVEVTRDDYLKCLNFVIKMYYSNAVPLSNFMTGQQRDIGQLITNHLIGKLGEIALKRLFYDRFGTDVRLDFGIHPREVSGQDIVEVARPSGAGRIIINPPRVRIAVKATKMKNTWLCVPEEEVTTRGRMSDYYVLARVDLPHDHLLRIVRGTEVFSSSRELIPKFQPVQVELAGYIGREALLKKGPVQEIETESGTQALSRPNYVCRSGELKGDPADWESLEELL